MQLKYVQVIMNISVADYWISVINTFLVRIDRPGDEWSEMNIQKDQAIIFFPNFFIGNEINTMTNTMPIRLDKASSSGAH